MGYGSAALQQLIDFFEMKGCSIEEPDAVKSSLLAAEKKGEEGAEEEEADEEEDDKEEEEEQEEDEEEEEEGDGEEEEEEKSVTSRKKGKHRSEAATDKPETSASSEDQSSSSSSAFLSSLSRKSLKPRPAPPLLSPCSSTLPDFQIDYFGVAFGLTAQLFRFWSRRQFVPVYIRQVATDVTGEFSCIMLRHAALPKRSTKREVKEKNKDKSSINGTDDNDDDALMKKNLWQGIDITGGDADKEVCLNNEHTTGRNPKQREKKNLSPFARSLSSVVFQLDQETDFTYLHLLCIYILVPLYISTTYYAQYKRLWSLHMHLAIRTYMVVCRGIVMNAFCTCCLTASVAFRVSRAIEHKEGHYSDWNSLSTQ